MSGTSRQVEKSRQDASFMPHKDPLLDVKIALCDVPYSIGGILYFRLNMAEMTAAPNDDYYKRQLFRRHGYSS